MEPSWFHADCCSRVRQKKICPDVAAAGRIHSASSRQAGGPRRIKTGLGNARTNYAQWLTIDEETWSGDSLQFRVRAVGQTADGKIEVFDDHVQLEVTLPWLLGKFAEKLAPAIRKEGVLMLEKK